MLEEEGELFVLKICALVHRDETMARRDETMARRDETMPRALSLII
jgi:hypothetical protein